jgi:phage host-nuclease inhibitor protein Gam
LPPHAINRENELAKSIKNYFRLVYLSLQLTELKAQHYELEKEMRDKKQALEKEYKRQIEDLQVGRICIK